MPGEGGVDREPMRHLFATPAVRYIGHGLWTVWDFVALAYVQAAHPTTYTNMTPFETPVHLYHTPSTYKTRPPATWSDLDPHHFTLTSINTSVTVSYQHLKHIHTTGQGSVIHPTTQHNTIINTTVTSPYQTQSHRQVVTNKTNHDRL